VTDGDPQVRFRAPGGLIEAVETVADEQDLSNSEAYRDLLRRGLGDLGADGLEYVADEALREQIIEEELPRKRRAWFRSNVGGRLLKCWNAGLDPEEAADDLASYRREALEIHDRPDLADYVNEGLNVYRDAHPNSGAKLSTWVKSRVPEDSDPSTVDTDHAETEVVADAEEVITAERSSIDLGTAADVWVSNVRTGVVESADAIEAEDAENVDATVEELREAVRHRLEDEGGDQNDE
jgi:hypothetical protein